MGLGNMWHWLLIAVVALLLFGGRNQLSNLMGDAAKGIKAFKDGLKDGGNDDDDKKKKVDGEEPKA